MVTSGSSPSRACSDRAVPAATIGPSTTCIYIGVWVTVIDIPIGMLPIDIPIGMPSDCMDMIMPAGSPSTELTEPIFIIPGDGIPGGGGPSEASC